MQGDRHTQQHQQNTEQKQPAWSSTFASTCSPKQTGKLTDDWHRASAQEA
jgi:hypothetical protein